MEIVNLAADALQSINLIYLSIWDKDFHNSFHQQGFIVRTSHTTNHDFKIAIATKIQYYNLLQCNRYCISIFI